MQVSYPPLTLRTLRDVTTAVKCEQRGCLDSNAYLCRSITTPDVSAADHRAVEPALLHELDLAFFEGPVRGREPNRAACPRGDGSRVRSHPAERLRPRVGEVASLDLVVRRLVERGLTEHITA